MDKKIILHLKEFYILETFQVAFYQAQISSAIDEYYSKAFEKMVKIEQSHADYFADQIRRIQETVPTLVGSIFELAGNFVGDTVELTGQRNTCKLGVALENKAMEMYRAFIAESAYKNYFPLRSTLMEYLLDEEFHTFWLRDYMNKY